MLKCYRCFLKNMSTFFDEIFTGYFKDIFLEISQLKLTYVTKYLPL